MEDSTELRVVQLNREAERLHIGGEAQEALRVANEALALASNLGKDHRLHAQCMNDLGALLRDNGELNQAEKLSLQALEIRRRTLGTQHADFAESLCNYGMVMKGLKRFGEAELHIRQAMDFFRASAGEKDPSFVICRNNLAAVFRESGNPAAAEELLRPAIEARKEEKREAPQDVSTQVPDSALTVSTKRFDNIDAKEIRVNLAAGPLPAPGSDIFNTVRSQLAAERQPALVKQTMKILTSLGLESSFEKDYSARIAAIQRNYLGADWGLPFEIADELERIHAEQVRHPNGATEIARLLDCIEQLRSEAAKQQEQQIGNAKVELRIYRYQIMAGSDKKRFKIRGWVGLVVYLLTKRTIAKVVDAIKYVKAIKPPHAVRGIMIQNNNRRGTDEELNVALLPLCRRKMTTPEFAAVETTLEYLVACGLEKSRLVNMPIEVLIGAALASDPEVAILKSRNLFRNNRWGIPEYMRTCAEKVHVARVKTHDLSFRKINELAAGLMREGQLSLEEANSLTLRLIFNFGFTEKSEIGFKQVMNLISLDGLSPAAYIGFVTSEQLARQLIRLGEVNTETRRITREWDVDIQEVLVSALVKRAVDVIPEWGLAKIQTDSLEDRLSRTHRSYSPDSNERLRIKERIRSGQEDNIYTILRYEVFGANADIRPVWPKWLNGDIWSDFPVWLRVTFFRRLIEQLKAR